MAGKRKQHSATFKAQVALAALKGDRTVNELAAQFSVHPTLIHGWKKQLLAGAETLFANGSKAAATDAEAEKTELFEQIGRLKMELEWLKKTRTANLTGDGRKRLVFAARSSGTSKERAGKWRLSSQVCCPRKKPPER